MQALKETQYADGAEPVYNTGYGNNNGYGHEAKQHFETVDVDPFTALRLEEESHQIKFRTLSWQKAALLLFGEYVCLAILALSWSWSVLGWVCGAFITFGLGLVTWYTSYTLWQFMMLHPECRDVCDIAAVLFPSIPRIAFEATAIMLLLNNIFLSESLPTGFADEQSASTSLPAQRSSTRSPTRRSAQSPSKPSPPLSASSSPCPVLLTTSPLCPSPPPLACSSPSSFPSFTLASRPTRYTGTVETTLHWALSSPALACPAPHPALSTG